MVTIKRRFSVSYSKVFEFFSCLSVEIISKGIFFFYVDFFNRRRRQIRSAFFKRRRLRISAALEAQKIEKGVAVLIRVNTVSPLTYFTQRAENFADYHVLQAL